MQGVNQALQRGSVPDVEVVVGHVGEGEVQGVHVGAGEGVGEGQGGHGGQHRGRRAAQVERG